MKIKVLNNNCIPTRAHDWDAGLDLKASHDCKILCGENKKIGLGICVEIPVGYVGLLFPRSGVSARTMLRCSNSVGVIDSGYTGEVCMLLTNTGQHDNITIHEGDRIGQLVVVPILDMNLEFVDELEDTERGTNGFGSTD